MNEQSEHEEDILRDLDNLVERAKQLDDKRVALKIGQCMQDIADYLAGKQ